MDTIRDLDILHPVLREAVGIVQENVIERYSMPFRIFETGRTMKRQRMLLDKRKVNSVMSPLFFNVDHDPPIYSTALVYVYYDGRWSWEIKKPTIKRWYQLFGELVLDESPVLMWGGYFRSSMDYTLFELRPEAKVLEPARNSINEQEPDRSAA